MSTALVPRESYDREPVTALKPSSADNAARRYIDLRQQDTNRNVHDVIPDDVLYTPMPKEKPSHEADMLPSMEQIRAMLRTKDEKGSHKDDYLPEPIKERKVGRPRRRILEKIVLKWKLIVSRTRMIVHA